MKFINKYQYQALKKAGKLESCEVFGESQTEQNQAMSMNQIIEKYKLLGVTPIAKKTYFDSEHGITDFPETERKDFDLADFSDLSEKLQKEAQKIKEIDDDNARKKAEEAFNKKIEAEIAKRKKEDEKSAKEVKTE